MIKDLGIKEFIQNNILQGVGDDFINEETDLLNNGVLDSFGIVQLINYFEVDLGISLESDEVNPDNFKSIRTLNILYNAKLKLKNSLE